jgi:Cys-tRNA(Pro)/Cys-tRNA(Cys) deacylase
VTAYVRPCYISAVTFVQEGGSVMAKSGKPTASTRATQALARAGIAFETLTYDYDPDAERIGLQAAEAIGEPPRRVLKTLMAEVDGRAVCVVVPSDHEVSMKKLAQAFGGKSAVMMRPTDAERITGYHVGGISPFGQKKRVPTAVEAAAMAEPYVFVNGGQRGLQAKLAPADLVRALGAVTAPLIV